MNHFKFCPYCKTTLEWDDIEGRKRLCCKSCGWINYKNPVPVVACLIRNDEGKLLLIKRAIDPCAGHWALPGGFIELDETIKEAGKRELFEETGLVGDPVRVVGARVQESEIYGFVLIVGVEYQLSGGEMDPGDDAQDANFFDINNLPEIPFKAQVRLLEDYLNSV